MSDDELTTILSSMEQDSTAYNSEFMSINEEYLRRYERELYGDEEDGFSQVVASDVRDIVEADMTSMVRVFLGSGDVFVFESVTDNPEAVLEAKTRTQYINHLILKRPGQYKVIHDFIKDAEIQKMGVVHYFMDEIRDTREIRYKDMDEVELTNLIDTIKSEDDAIADIEIVAKEEIKDSPKVNVRLRITTTQQDLVTLNIPTEDFLITKGSATVDDASMVGHVSFPTRGELVAGGMDENEVAQFQQGNIDSSVGSNQTNQYQGETMRQIRWRDEGGDVIDTDAFKQWSNETVRVVTSYAKVDFDGDGIAERRRFVKIGNTVTENEPYDHVPYAVMSAIIDPHKAIGDSRSSLVVEDQSVNTALHRALLDNTYDVTRPRTLLGNGVNIDDFMDHRTDGIVRMNEDSGESPAQSIQQLTTPYIGNETLQVLQHRDQQQAARTGTMLDSQGLDADQLHKETATRFQGIEKSNEAKIELVARNYAEVGFRKLYEGVAWTVNRFQDKEQQVRITGKAITVNPADWKFPSLAVSQVGLGAGSGQKAFQQMTGILQIQNQLKAQGSLLTDDTKVYNSLDKMVQGLGLARTSDYFNNPEIPNELIMAQLEKVTAALQQSQQMIEQLSQQNPLAEAEMIKAQASLQKATQASEVALIKADADTQQKEIETLQKANQFQAEQTLEYTKLELDHNVDIPGEGQGQ